MLILKFSHKKLNTFISYFKRMDFRDGELVTPIFRHLNVSLTTKKHNLHCPHAKRETGISKGRCRMWRHGLISWGHQEATKLTWQAHAHKDHQDHTRNCATCSALQRDDLSVWEGKKKTLAETRVCSQASLPCPLVVMSCSSREQRKKERQKDSGKQERRGTRSLMSYTSVQPLPAPLVRSGRLI